MKTKQFVIVLLLALVIGGSWQVAGAAPRPAIITFDSSLKTITLAETEAGQTITTLTWHTIGVTDDYRLTLHQYVLDKWELVFDEDSVPLEPDGARVVTVRHPLDFGPPTFLLSIVDTRSNSIVTQRTLTIPYDTAVFTSPPDIDSFTTSADSVDATKLAAGESSITLTWTVDNRVPTANLVFDQVFEDDTAQSVELPRQTLWVPSSGEGPVAPVVRAGEDMITLRLRVVDLVSETIYAEETLKLAVENAPEPEPEATPAPVETPKPEPTAPPAGEIVSFSVAPNTVNPGAAVTLAWDIRGTGGVTIQQTVPNVPGETMVVNAQSPKGSAEVYLPDNALYSVTFTLYTANRSSSAQAAVAVNCPFTFFFGAADGCPSGPERKIGASYQAFENGMMLWRSDTNEIYVFYSDGTAAYFLEGDYANLSEPDLEEAPPLDRHAPIRGFGKVWANAPGVREKLGWAFDEEQGYNASFQSVAQTRAPRPAFAFYMTLPGGEVVGSGYGIWKQLG